MTKWKIPFAVLLTAGAILAYIELWPAVSARPALEGGQLEQIRRALTSGATVVDVRTEAEFARGHVAGAVNIPLHRLPDKLHLIEDRAAPLVLYCRSGNRSARAATFLRARGYTEVLDMKTMAVWRMIQSTGPSGAGERI